ncbi:MAG: sigma-70 family RNA polymerase sigma factor [Sedimentisphaerales bacterium]|nr:sigma-70 family RNA polymerase sigma factor [Sedimentisphaerales bacterium]
MTAINQNQLARWYDAYGNELKLYALQWSPDQQAEDIVQDAFIKLLKQRRPPNNVRAWLFRVVRNTSISKLRFWRQRQKADEKFLQQNVIWFESSPDDLIDARLAQKILQTLPSNLREIVMLRIWGQMSLKEIAGITGKSIPWIHKEYKEALEMIRKELEHSSCIKKKT